MPNTMPAAPAVIERPVAWGIRAGLRCKGCTFLFLPGDLIADGLKPAEKEGAPPDVVRVHFNSVCWRDVDPEADWFWEEGPASVVVQDRELDQSLANPKDLEIAKGVVAVVNAAIAKRDAGEVVAFRRLLDEAEDMIDPAYAQLHLAESIAAERAAAAEEWWLPPRAAAAMEAARASVNNEAAARASAPVLKATQPSGCWLCDVEFASGEIVLVHGQKIDSYEPTATSHFHCALTGANSANRWEAKDGGPSATSEPFKAMVGLRTFSAMYRPLSPDEYSWREKRWSKTLKSALGALAEGWGRHAYPSALRLTKVVERESKILRGRKANGATSAT